MKAAVLHGPRDLRIEDAPDPCPPQEDEVLLRVAAAGICGSDLHCYQHGGIGTHSLDSPMIVGHEVSAWMETADATSGKEQQLVVVEPAYACGHCRECLDWRYNLCRNMKVLGTPPHDGAMCELLVAPRRFVHPVPDGLSPQLAALAEPMAVACHAVKLARVEAGDRVAILGSATIGLLLIAAARASGAQEVYVTDVLPSRLEHALALGATDTANAAETDIESWLADRTKGQGCDVVFEAAGTPATLLQTTRIVQPGGTVVIIGITGNDVVPFDFGTARRKECTIISARRYCYDFPAALRLLASGFFDPARLITHEFPLNQAPKAFELCANQPEKVVKCVIRVAQV